MQEVIPKTELMTYYAFELVHSTVITETGIKVLVNIPIHHTMGLHEVYRAISIPQPSDGGTTATQYKFSHMPLLVSEHRDNFAEVSRDVIAAHCSGSNRLNLCLRPFAMFRSSESSCLASLFFDLPTTALILYPQEGCISLTRDSYGHVSGRFYILSNFTGRRLQAVQLQQGAKESGQPIAGCQSCLLQRSCEGRIETPDGRCFGAGIRPENLPVRYGHNHYH